jgi:hypothetical protein
VPGKKPAVALISVQSEGDATATGFDNFNGDDTLGGQYQFSSTIGGTLPGNYRIIAGYSNKDIPSFDIDPRQLLNEIIGAVRSFTIIFSAPITKQMAINR